MTRETKVGLVVVSSFLSLVAGVFIVKYSDFGTSAAPDAGTTTVASTGDMHSPSIPAAPSAPSADDKTLVTTPSELAPIPLTPLPTKNEGADLVALRPLTTPLAPPPTEVLPTRFETTPTTPAPLPDPPPGSETKKTETPPKIVIPDSEPTTIIDLPPVTAPGAESKKTDSPPALKIPGDEKSSDPPSIKLEPSEPKKTETKPKADPKKPATDVLDLLPPGGTTKPENKDKPNDAVVIPLPDPAPKSDAPKAIDLGGSDKKIANPDDSIPPALKPPGPPKPSTPDPWKPAESPKVKSPEPAKLLELPKTGAASKPDPGAVAIPDPSRLTSPSNDPPAVRLQLPVGSAPDLVNPPARNNLEPEPRVDSYEEEWYSCQAGDTLERISQRFFNTEKYAQALRLHNLDRDGRDLWRQDRPMLQAGDIVKVPPTRVLERNHPAVVPGAKMPPGVRPESSFNVGTTTGRDLTPPASMQTSNSGPPSFRVPRDGMTFRDVARETLGATDKWMLVFRLNRGFNPEQPLPKDAMLRLPSDARVP